MRCKMGRRNGKKSKRNNGPRKPSRGFEPLEDRRMLSSFWGDAWSAVSDAYNNYAAPVVGAVTDTISYGVSAFSDAISNTVLYVESAFSGSGSSSSSSVGSNTNYASSSNSSNYSNSYNTSTGSHTASQTQVGFNPISAIASVANTAVQTITTAIADIGTAVENIIVKPVVEATQAVGQAIGNTVVDTVSGVTNYVGSIAGNAVKAVDAVFGGTQSNASSQSQNQSGALAGNSVANAVDAVMAGIGKAIDQGVVKPVEHVITEAASNINQLYNQVVGYNGFSVDYHSFENGIALLTATLTDAAIGIPAKIECAIAGTVTPEKVKQAIVSFITGAEQPVANSVVQAVATTASDVSNATAKMVNSTINTGRMSTFNFFGVAPIVFTNVVGNGFKELADYVVGHPEVVTETSKASIEALIGPIKINVVNFVQGVRDGVVNMVQGIGSLAVDAFSVTPVGIAIAPDNAANTAQKWVNVATTLVTDPGKLVDAVVEPYIQEYQRGGIAGAVGYAVPDVALAIATVGGGSATAKGVDVAADVGRTARVVDEVSRVSRVVEAESFLAKNILPKDPGVWNVRTIWMDVETGVKEMPVVTVRERLDFSGITHSVGSAKNVDPHINVEIIDKATGKVVKEGVVNQQLPGFNGLQYGGRFSSGSAGG